MPSKEKGVHPHSPELLKVLLGLGLSLWILILSMMYLVWLFAVYLSYLKVFYYKFVNRSIYI